MALGQTQDQHAWKRHMYLLPMQDFSFSADLTKQNIVNMTNWSNLSLDINVNYYSIFNPGKKQNETSVPVSSHISPGSAKNNLVFVQLKQGLFLVQLFICYIIYNAFFLFLF